MTIFTVDTIGCREFFKIIMPEMEEHTRIPKAFENQCNCPLIGNCRLKVKGDNRWFPMKIKEDIGAHDNRLKLCEGWADFVRANNVEWGDLLTFEFDLVRSAHHRPVFNVKIYGRSSCLKPLVVRAD